MNVAAMMGLADKLERLSLVICVPFWIVSSSACRPAGTALVGRAGRSLARSRPGAQRRNGCAARDMPARASPRARLPDQIPAPERPRDLSPESTGGQPALAYQARAEVPWGRGLPEDVFLDAVLPHASVTEPRDSMRAEFHTRYLPLVNDCKTPGQAALAINKKLFADFKVGYNTRRLRTDQNSKESIAQGMATCTGLSIMFVEACRSVAVPARLAGIASWPGRGGNHTWVEVWDNGWHFVGAAEPDDKGLDHAWFVGDASKAMKGSPPEMRSTR